MTSEPKAVVLTDLVGSTTLAESLGEARVAQIWSRHDRAARDLLSRFSGLEIDKSDGFLLLFDDVERAVGFAMSYHAALSELGRAEALPGGLAARVGIHFGDVTLRRNDAADVARGAKAVEVEGVAKAVAARTMSIAIGGQTLLTGAAQQRFVTTGDQLVHDHGFFKMKGMSDPLALYEVGTRGHAPLVPPPDGEKVYRVVRDNQGWRPARDIPTNLPAERDNFFGRGAELGALADKIDAGARLVSVLGPPGTGKTRFARRFASQWRGEFPGGVWVCDFTDVHTLADLCRVVGAATDIPAGPGDPVEHIGRALRGRPRTLLVLDNLERVVELGQASIAVWLEVAPELVVVATSRSRLRLRGEHAIELLPLPLPPPGDAPAVALFAERARQVQPQFELTAANLPIVIDIVRRLDGLPLAIELAAARVRAMDPAAIRDRLGQRFRLLVGGQRDSATRQATLRGAIDWSWELCSPAEQRAAASVSVFRGGFDLAAAEAVIGDDDPNAPMAFELVEALADKSLVQSVETKDGIRFSVYESIREYLAERLDSFSTAAAARNRHAAFYAQALPPNGARVRWAAQQRKQVLRELGNLRAAQPWAVEQRLPESATLTLVVGQALAVVAQNREALTVLHAFDSSDPALVVSALACRGVAELETGHPDAAISTLTEAIALADRNPNVELQAMVRRRLGHVFWRVGRGDDLKAILGEAMARLPAHADPAVRAETGLFLGVHALHEGRVDEAAPYYQALLAAAEASGEPSMLEYAYSHMAILAMAQERPDQAIAFGERTIALAREMQLRLSEVNAVSNLTQVLLQVGRIDDARAQALHNLAETKAIGALRQIGSSTNYLALILLGDGDVEGAARHCTLDETTLQADRRVRADYLGLVACVAAARGDLDLAARTLAEARAEGEALHDYELAASAEAFSAWVEVHTAKHGQGDTVTLVASARQRCRGLPAWLSHFGSRVLRVADEVEAG